MLIGFDALVKLSSGDPGPWALFNPAGPSWHAPSLVVAIDPLTLQVSGWGAFNPTKIRYVPPPETVKDATLTYPSAPFDLPIPWDA